MRTLVLRVPYWLSLRHPPILEGLGNPARTDLFRDRGVTVSYKIILLALSIFSALSSGFFGALALVSDFKRAGKLTRWGAVAIIGIVLSAALSITADFVKRHLELEEDAAKDAKEARESAAALRAENIRSRAELARYANNMAQFKKISGQMQSNVDRLELLRVQQKEDSAQLGDDVWREANAVSPRSVSARMSIRCDGIDTSAVAQLFRNASLSAKIVKRSELGVKIEDWDSLTEVIYRSNAPEITMYGDYPDLKINLQNKESYQYVLFNEITFFGLGKFRNIENWRDALMVPWVTSHNNLTDDLKHDVESFMQTDRGERFVWTMKEIEPNRDANPLPCNVNLAVHVNGRRVFDAAGVLVVDNNSGQLGGPSVETILVAAAAQADEFPRRRE